jgi:hypothetical protein
MDAMYLFELGQKTLLMLVKDFISKTLAGLKSKKSKCYISFDNDQVGPSNTQKR